jgi:hypothetical protein
MKHPTVDQLKRLYDVDISKKGFEGLASNRDGFHETLDGLPNQCLALWWDALKTLRSLGMAVYYTAHKGDYGLRIGKKDKRGPFKAKHVLSMIYCNTGALEFDINVNPAEALKGFNLQQADRVPLFNGEQFSDDGRRWMNTLQRLSREQANPILERFRQNNTEDYCHIKAEKAFSGYLPRDFPAPPR